MQCDYQGCTIEATHVLVDYHHQVIGDNAGPGADGTRFCHHHAFSDEREACPVCTAARSTTQVFDETAEQDVEMLRTYPPGTLDGEGCCSDHP